jgi:hypothetical protein
MIPRFLCDEMNGDVARWLRIMGFDCKYIIGDNLDEKLIEICRREGRVLITSDVELSIRASSRGIRCILTNGLNRSQKLRKIIDTYGLKDYIGRKFRCPKCNTILKKVNTDDIIDKIPLYVVETYDHVWECKGCGKIYWEGSHWRNISEYIEKLLSSR